MFRIFALSIWLICSISTYAFGPKVIRVSNRSLDINEIMIVHFLKVNSSVYYEDFSVLSKDCQTRARLYGKFRQFTEGAIDHEVDSVLYDFLYQSTTGGFTDFLFEVSNPDSTAAIGIVYGDSDFELGTPLTTSQYNSFTGFVDSLNDANNTSLTYPPTANFTTKLQTSYAISFDQPDPYKSQYTTQELLYEVYYDSATDDGKLELIKDTDRDNELVGFRYYSDKNSQEYTVFIKANN